MMSLKPFLLAAMAVVGFLHRHYPTLTARMVFLDSEERLARSWEGRGSDTDRGDTVQLGCSNLAEAAHRYRTLAVGVVDTPPRYSKDSVVAVVVDVGLDTARDSPEEPVVVVVDLVQRKGPVVAAGIVDGQ